MENFNNFLNVNAWNTKERAQNPNWVNTDSLNNTMNKLTKLPPLVFAGEIRNLHEQLSNVEDGNGFLLQAGDCAETFDECSAPIIREKLKVILQMAIVLTYSAGVGVVKVGRIAGQYAKPRSSEFETKNDISLPSFKGDIINGFEFEKAIREPNPDRILEGYYKSVATLNLIRAYTKGGFANLNRVHNWNEEFIASSPVGKQYEEIASQIDNALAFMTACGINLDTHPAIKEVDFFTSHEALVLEYEHSLTRKDSLTEKLYDCSAHTVWLGERTRKLDGAHIAFLNQIENPIGVKVGPDASDEDIVDLINALNPNKIKGRLTIINRVGHDKSSDLIASRISAVKKAGLNAIWACDPMHGNTYESESGKKTRHFDDIMLEVRNFFEGCQKAYAWPGGLHIELTGENVTECIGGGFDISDEELNSRYETLCDPRLNRTQSLDLAFEVAKLLHNMRK